MVTDRVDVTPAQGQIWSGAFGEQGSMDGLPHGLALQANTLTQRTLATAIGCVGTGLHSGRRVGLTLLPLPPGSGIIFRRTDLDPKGGAIDIPARHDHVVDTKLCTVIGDNVRRECRVSTVEHVLAALAGCGVHNALVEVDGPEVPILDGSSASFVFLIDCAGIVDQGVAAARIEILRPVRVESGLAFAELRPNSFGFDMALSIDFEAAAIGRQAMSLHLSPGSFRDELAHCRTFTLAHEVAALRAAGLALGGSLDNAIVVDGDRVLNPAGLRAPDEFVRHKLLDAVGDLALSGSPLCGRFVAHRTGHALNNKLLLALFADDANWRLVIDDAASHPVWQPLSAAA